MFPCLRKHSLLLGGVAAVGLVAFTGCPEPEASEQRALGNDSSPVEQPPSVDQETFGKMKRARAHEQNEEWTLAGRIYQEVVDLDPINREAREGVRRASLNGKMLLRFRDAKAKRDIGEMQKALEIFMSIDKESRYYGPAQYEVATLVPDMLKKSAGDCLGNHRARRWKAALRTCRAHEDLACQCPELYRNEQVSRHLRDAEGQQRVSAADAWRCRTLSEAWVPCGDPGGAGGCSAAATERYDSAEIRAAVVLYCEGQAVEAMRKLAKIIDRSSASERNSAEGLFSSMKVADGKWKEGASLNLKGEPEQAQKAWQSMLAAEGMILPGVARSHFRRESEKGLHKAFLARGQEQMSMKRYPEAFTWAMKGMAVGKGNPFLKQLIQRLEEQAAIDLRESTSCGEFQRITTYTRAEPPSPTHKQAIAELKRLSCQ